MYKILIVEDDEIIARTIKEHLCKWDFDAECIRDFKNVSQQVKTFSPHLILLDISLPYFNGFYWCNEIRRFSKVPVVFISSADDKMSIVMAVNMGGDDFISKPFDLNVLTAKVQALLRRTYDFTEDNTFLEYNGIKLNLSDASVDIGGNNIELTKNEYRILQILLENTGKIVSRDMLMQKLWDSENFIDDNTLTVNINRLRKKLSENGVSDFVRTKKGMGYIIE